MLDRDDILRLLAELQLPAGAFFWYRRAPDWCCTA